VCLACAFLCAGLLWEYRAVLREYRDFWRENRAVAIRDCVCFTVGHALCFTEAFCENIELFLREHWALLRITKPCVFHCRARTLVCSGLLQQHISVFTRIQGSLAGE